MSGTRFRMSRVAGLAGGVGILACAAVAAAVWPAPQQAPSLIADSLHAGMGDPVATATGMPVDGSVTVSVLARIHDRAAGGVPAYDRVVDFGPAWVDVDGNGCDTRNDILARDLVDIVRASDGCKVLSGTLHDPYTGDDVYFRRGVDTSAAVQVDHVKSTTRPCFCSEVADHIGNGMPLTCVRGS